MEFTKTPGWLDWYTGLSKPRFQLPPGGVDALCHVFGPGEQFPYAVAHKYTPCNASKDQLFALRDHLGFDKNVIVQATCHGSDNRALVDALKASNNKARGVATVKRDVTDTELHDMHAAGVRGTRFNFVKRLADFTPREVLLKIANRIAPLGIFFRYIGVSATYIARYDELFNDREEKLNRSGAAVSMNGIELQDREFFAAIRDGRQPNSSVAGELPCYQVLHGLKRQLKGLDQHE